MKKEQAKDLKGKEVKAVLVDDSTDFVDTNADHEHPSAEEVVQELVEEDQSKVQLETIEADDSFPRTQLTPEMIEDAGGAKVSEEETPKAEVTFGIEELKEKWPPPPPESKKLGEGEQPEKTEPPNKQLVEEDERFKKPEPEHKDMKKRMEKELAKDKRINIRARVKRFWTGDTGTDGWTFQKWVKAFTIIGGFLFNLFTVAVIIYCIVDVIIAFRSDLHNYFQAIKIALEGVFIWMVVKIHEKIEV